MRGIRQLRQALKLHRKEFGALLDLSDVSIEKYESEIPEPKAKMAVQIAIDKGLLDIARKIADEADIDIRQNRDLNSTYQSAHPPKDLGESNDENIKPSVFPSQLEYSKQVGIAGIAAALQSVPASAQPDLIRALERLVLSVSKILSVAGISEPKQPGEYARQPLPFNQQEDDSKLGSIARNQQERKEVAGALKREQEGTPSHPKRDRVHKKPTVA